MEMPAPSASEPTTVPLRCGVERTLSAVPLVLTVPVAEAQAADMLPPKPVMISAMVASTSASRPNRAERGADMELLHSGGNRKRRGRTPGRRRAGWRRAVLGLHQKPPERAIR